MSDDDKDTSGLGIIEEARKRFKQATDAYSESRRLAVADTQFAFGDSDNGWQWAEDLRKRRMTDGRVCLTINLTAQHCNQVINAIRQSRPSCRVMPVDNNGDKKTAEIFSGIIRNIQVLSQADDCHDIAAEHAIYGGFGYWRVITEYASESSFDQVIKIKACPNPQLVYIDPTATEPDKSDAEWAFVFEDISREQFEREHPDIDQTSWGNSWSESKWATNEMVRRAEYFFVERVADTALLLSDGTSLLESQLGDGFQKVKKTLVSDDGQVMQIVNERTTERKQWKWCRIVGGHDEPLDLTDWAGKYLPIIAVVGKEININGEVLTKGLVRDLKDPARMVSYAYSEAIQTVALQNKVPYLAAAEAIEGYEPIWGGANAENRAFLPYRAFNESGNPLPMPSRQPAAVLPSAQLQLLEISTNEMRGVSGQQNANFGVRSEASSGIGIQRLKQQGEVATFHFGDNLARGLRYEARVLIDLIQKVYDTKRVMRIIGLDGKQESVTLDPDHPVPYSESETTEGDIQKIFNPTAGDYDVVIDTGPSYQTQRQEAFAALTDLAGRSPQLMGVAGDIIMRAADFPMAEQLADRLAKSLPPALQDQKGGAQAQLQQAMQQAQQAQQQLQQLQQQAQEMQVKLQQAESGQAKTQAEIQARLQLAQFDAQIQAQKQQADLQAKQYQAQMDLNLKAEIAKMEIEARQQQAALDAQLTRQRVQYEIAARKEQAVMDAKLALEAAKRDNDAKMQIAQMEIESKEEIAELNAYVELEKTGVQPMQELVDDVQTDISTEKD